VGLDSGTPVDDQDYQVPFRFTGKIGRLTVKLGPVEPALLAYNHFDQNPVRLIDWFDRYIPKSKSTSVA
jgi:hypothetical protein